MSHVRMARLGQETETARVVAPRMCRADASGGWGFGRSGYGEGDGAGGSGEAGGTEAGEEGEAVAGESEDFGDGPACQTFLVRQVQLRAVVASAPAPRLRCPYQVPVEAVGPPAAGSIGTAPSALWQGAASSLRREMERWALLFDTEGSPAPLGTSLRERRHKSDQPSRWTASRAGRTTSAVNRYRDLHA